MINCKVQKHFTSSVYTGGQENNAFMELQDLLCSFLQKLTTEHHHGYFKLSFFCRIYFNIIFPCVVCLFIQTHLKGVV
jgi:hypothetical protein